MRGRRVAPCHGVARREARPSSDRGSSRSSHASVTCLGRVSCFSSIRNPYGFILLARPVARSRDARQRGQRDTLFVPYTVQTDARCACMGQRATAIEGQRRTRNVDVPRAGTRVAQREHLMEPGLPIRYGYGSPGYDLFTVRVITPLGHCVAAYKTDTPYSAPGFVWKDAELDDADAAGTRPRVPPRSRTTRACLDVHVLPEGGSLLHVAPSMHAACPERPMPLRCWLS